MFRRSLLLSARRVTGLSDFSVICHGKERRDSLLATNTCRCNKSLRATFAPIRPDATIECRKPPKFFAKTLRTQQYEPGLYFTEMRFSLHRRVSLRSNCIKFSRDHVYVGKGPKETVVFSSTNPEKDHLGPGEEFSQD